MSVVQNYFYNPVDFSEGKVILDAFVLANEDCKVAVESVRTNDVNGLNSEFAMQRWPC